MSDPGSASSSEEDNLLGDEDDLQIIQEPIEEQTVNVENDFQDAVNVEQNDEAKENETKREVKPKKISHPRLKLNLEVLKGKKGLTAIPDHFKKVKFKGPGHEENDLNLLMKHYEYWCHRMFPKLPFDDCIATIEKLGTKRITQTYLKKFRYDMLYDDEIQHEQEEEDQPLTEPDPFDELLPQIPVTTNESQALVDVSEELTEEQLELIRINRERAAKLRQEKIKAAELQQRSSCNENPLQDEHNPNLAVSVQQTPNNPCNYMEVGQNDVVSSYPSPKLVVSTQQTNHSCNNMEVSQNDAVSSDDEPMDHLDSTVIVTNVMVHQSAIEEPQETDKSTNMNSLNNVPKPIDHLDSIAIVTNVMVQQSAIEEPRETDKSTNMNSLISECVEFYLPKSTPNNVPELNNVAVPLGERNENVLHDQIEQICDST